MASSGTNDADGTPEARGGGVVIPFPVRAGADRDPQLRLARALESLNAALDTQRRAMAAWREVLKDMRSTTSSLDESLQRYRSSLRSLGSSVSELQDKARCLETWADGVMSGGR